MILQDEIAEGVYERLQVIEEPRRLPGIIERESRSELPSALVRLLAMTTAAEFEDTYGAFGFSWSQGEFPFESTKVPINQNSAAGDRVDEDVSDADVSV